MHNSGHIVTVSKLRFHGFHGVTDEERTLGTQLQASIVVNLPPSLAETSDDIADTVSYIDLAEILIEVSNSRKFNTLEALSRTYIDETFRRFPQITNLFITLEKPNPPTYLQVESVGVSFSSRNPNPQANL